MTYVYGLASDRKSGSMHKKILLPADGNKSISRLPEVDGHICGRK